MGECVRVSEFVVVAVVDFFFLYVCETLLFQLRTVTATD